MGPSLGVGASGDMYLLVGIPLEEGQWIEIEIQRRCIETEIRRNFVGSKYLLVRLTPELCLSAEVEEVWDNSGQTDLSWVDEMAVGSPYLPSLNLQLE